MRLCEGTESVTYARELKLPERVEFNKDFKCDIC